MMRVPTIVGLACLLMVNLTGCQQKTSGKSSEEKAKPAKIKSIPSETSLVELELTQKAHAADSQR